MRVILWICVILLLQVSWSWGKVYKWIDDDGKVHFTDNPSTIPNAYRQQLEPRPSQTTPSMRLAERQARSQPYALIASTRAARPSRAFVVPFQRDGNALLVQATLNGFARAPMVVDTGASLTVISTQMARRAGLDLARAALIAMRSVSGTFLAHLTKVRSMQVGDAVLKDVEVVVHDILPGRARGLLGMSFLDHFDMTLHTLQDAMRLKPLNDAAGAALYGGKPQSWWRSKFRFYRQQVSLLSGYIAEQSTPQLEQSRRYFQSELARLERRATLASVPRAWRY